MSTHLPRLQITETLVDDKGRPTKLLQKRWEEFASTIETQVNGVQEALDLIAAQQLILTDLVDFQQNFIDAIAPLIVNIESRVSSIEARLLAAGIP